MPCGFDILFEDETCLAVAKPAGLLTQAPLGIDSLEYRIKRFLSERAVGQASSLPLKDVYLGVPHRLDRPVSGAIVFAKTLKAAQRISKQFENRRVTKTYWALVEGHIEPAAGTWTDHLKKIDGEPRTIVVEKDEPDGRIAVLHYRVLQQVAAPANRSLLEITLETGRTHQIRVQCSSRGHPLLGDELYGSQIPFGPPSDDQRERLIALHARLLKFWHHAAGDYINVTAPLPDYWRNAGVELPGA
ncbi:MAG TPA: RluA family pseudouridine synthase [Pirellulaceae bacterium]|jgi:RluA family pseudouridine synthase